MPVRSVQRINAWQCPLNLNNHRYRLGFEINPRGRGRVLFIGLNPSTATLTTTDSTVDTFCKGIAFNKGFREMEIINLFAYRSTSKNALLKVKDPIGAKNNHFTRIAVSSADLIVAAWGQYFHPTICERALDVLTIIREHHTCPIRAITLNADGSPAHPLYKRTNSSLIALKWNHK